MDHAITRAAGATPRAVGEFQGFIDGEPAVAWADRKNMPQVGDKLFALPRQAAVPRSWSILLTSANHGTVGPVGSTFPHAGEQHERVQVMEIVEAGAAPAPGADLAGLVRLELTNEQIAAGAAIECDHGAPIGRNAAIDVFDAMSGTTLVAAQAESELLPDWISYDAGTDTLTMHGIAYSAELFRTLGIAPVGESFTIVARGNGVLALSRSAPVAAQAGQVAVPEAVRVLREAIQKQLAPEWVCNSDHPALAAALKATEHLAAPAQAKPLPAPEVPLWDENGEPWNLAAEQVEYERAQASTAGGRQEGGAA